MTIRICAGAVLAIAVALTAVSAPSDAIAESQKKRTVTTKKAPAKKIATAPRARITVQRRSFLDPGRHIIPGSQREFTDYAFPPGYSPTSVIDYRSGGRALPGPFDLPGRDNPYPWNWCVGC